MNTLIAVVLAYVLGGTPTPESCEPVKSIDSCVERSSDDHNPEEDTSKISNGV